MTQVYSVEEEPVPYLVMEFIDGQTLQSKQRKQGPLEVAELLHIGRQIAAGLAAAHEKSLIHRDVKPGNILLEQGGEQKVKITDFGLARAADDASLTRSGMISGTPLYMAPEQPWEGPSMVALISSAWGACCTSWPRADHRSGLPPPWLCCGVWWMTLHVRCGRSFRSFPNGL